MAYNKFIEGDPPQHPFAVGDDDDSPLKFVNSVDQGFDRLDIEVMCRFVEKKQITGLRNDLAQKNTALFSPRKDGNQFFGRSPLNIMSPQMAAHPAEVQGRVRRCDLFFDAQFRIEAIDRSLAKIPQPHRRGRSESPLAGSQLPVEKAQKGGLSITVLSDDRDPIPLFNAEGKIFNERSYRCRQNPDGLPRSFFFP